MKRTLSRPITLFLAMTMMMAALSGQQRPTMGHAPVNGLNLYYEVLGNGPPLVLLHGGVLPFDATGAPVAAMSRTHQVITVHLRGHGRSTDSDEPWSAEAMADDVAGVLRHLGIDKASVMGYSLGAGVALQVAIRHPALVEKLVVVSVAFRTDGMFPEVREAFAQMPSQAADIGRQLAASPFGQQYPDVDWERVMRKTAAMNQPERDWTAGIRTLTSPTLLVFADADFVSPGHMAEFWRLLGGGQRDAGLDGSLRPAGQLAIIPNTTHYSLIQSPLLTEIATAFLMQ